MNSTEMTGIIVPVITPVDSEDRVDEVAYRAQLRRLIKAGVQGVFAGGSAGEGPLLTLHEWERMALLAFEECHGKIHLLGGTMETSTRRIIGRIKVLAQIGYENFVVAPTFYVGAKHPSEHLRLFGECKKNSEGMNMIAYNIPSCTGSTISIEVMVEIVRRGWISYCKDSSEDMDYFRRLLAEAGPLGLRVFLGTERKAAEGLLAGAVGLVPTCANYDPGTFLSAYEARANNEELARLQIIITSLVNNLLLAPRLWLGGIKYAVSTLGIGSGRVVSPLEPANEEERRLIDAFLRARPFSGGAGN
jgi:4-hydroxy-tetrahydrodipicolinate synthase